MYICILHIHINTHAFSTRFWARNTGPVAMPGGAYEPGLYAPMNPISGLGFVV